MIRILTVFLLALGLSSLTGCFAPVPAWKTIPHGSVGIERLPDLDSVTLYLFSDERGIRWPGRTTRIGEVFMPGTKRPRYPVVFLYGKDPAAVTVTRAFAAGLVARGFSLVDLTSQPFVDGQTKSATRSVISGTVGTFYGSVESGRGWGVANCSVSLRVHDGATGRMTWDATYAASEFIWDRGNDELDELASALTQVLARTVRDALGDANFLAQVRGSR